MKLTPKSIALPLALCPVLPALAKDFKPGALRPKAAGLPHGLNIVDWKQIRAEYEKHRHGAFPSAGGGLEARSFEQQWLSKFDGRGFTVTPDEGRWSWGLELAGVAGKATVTKDVNRITYRWSKDLEEWFVNDTRGLEHGFTLSAPRPELRFAVRGGLVPRLAGAGVEFVDASGTPRMKYFGLTAHDADGKLLKSAMKVDAGQVILSVNDHGARYPLTIDPTVQQAYLKASNASVDDGFGQAVAISGDTVVVTTVKEDSGATGVNGSQSDNSVSNSGAAYVFVRSGITWTQQAYLKASNTGSNDLFGFSVAISGDTILVGAPEEDSNATVFGGSQSDNSATNSGAVYVFVRNGTTWSQQTYQKSSNTGAGDSYGWSVAISGNTMVVGASSEDSNATGVEGAQVDNSATDSGAAYVIVRSGTTWNQQAYLKASNTGAIDIFGWSVAISGDTIVVGARLEDSNATGVGGTQSNDSASGSGAAYVFLRSGTTWTQQAYLKASNTGNNYEFGSSVGISGDTIVVGSVREASNSTGVGGNEADTSAFGSGAAYVFFRSGSTWSQQAYVKASNTASDDLFGETIAISGDTIVVGARGEDSNAAGVNGDGSNNGKSGAGAAYVFTRSGATWSQQLYLKASNPDTDDAFTVGVAVDSGTIVVGATQEDSDATTINGDGVNNNAFNAGAAYVFGPSTIGVTLATSPAGRTFTTSGTGCAPGTYTAPQTLQWTPASTCTVSVTTPQTATGTEFRLSQWEDASTFTTRSITAPASPTTYTATFDTYYLLTTSAGTGGTVSAGGFVLSGTNTSVTATPSLGYAFNNFTGAVTSTSNPLSLLMDAPKSITANFSVFVQTQSITFGAPPSPAIAGTSVTVSATGGGSGNPVLFSLPTPINVQFACTAAGSCNGNGGSAATLQQSGAAVVGTTGDQWNRVSGVSGLGVTGTNVPLVDRSGTATPVTVSWTSITSYSVQSNPGAFGSTPFANLMSSYLVIHNGEPAKTITLAGLVPNAPYRLYMITQGDFGTGGRRTSFAVNGAAPVSTTAGANINTFVANQNYVLLNVNANSSGVLNVVYDVVAGEANVNGFQLEADNTVCSVSGTNVTLHAPGTCAVQASQAGNAGYTAATPVIQSFTVTSLVGVTITSSPSGLSFSTTGTGCASGTYTSPQTLQWTIGSACSVTFATPQSGGTGVEYRFNHWEDSSTAAARSITAPSSATSYDAAFDTYYQLTTAAGLGGSVSTSTFVLAGTNANITATPTSGFAFSNFTGAVTSTSNPLSLLMDAPKSVTANFSTTGAPLLTAAIASKANGALPNERIWTLRVTNTGSGAITNVRVTSVQVVAVNPSTASVTLGTTSYPAAVANPALSPGQFSTVPVSVIFPASPTARIQFRINLAGDNGYTNSVTLSNVTR